MYTRSLSLVVSLVLVALTAAATPLVSIRDATITLPFAKRMNSTGPISLHARDLARARHLRATAEAKLSGRPFQQNSAIGSVPATNELVAYVVDVGVGSPATTYSLLVDTGSSNTWVGAQNPYIQTSTSVQTGDRVSVTYGSGSFSGNEFTDTVTLGASVIQRQSIGVASQSQGFDGVDGILGLGPVDLTVDTLSPDTNTPIPTVTDNLFTQGTIPSNVLSVSFAPSTSVDPAVNGELTFGGTDPTRYTGEISYSPITSTEPASEFWGLDQAIVYGSSTPILSSTAGIVDTGSSLILIADDALARYRRATGAVDDQDTGLLRISASRYSNLKSLYFTIGGATFEFTANAQIWPCYWR